MSIPEWVAIIALGAILAIVGWGFRRVVDTQDEMAENVATMALDITKLCGKLELAAFVQTQDKMTCERRHEENLDRFREVRQELQSLQG